MTDTKEMRAAFEVDFRERYSIPDTIPLSGCGGVECEWRGFQAAWTRKPAEQVAGAVGYAIYGINARGEHYIYDVRQIDADAEWKSDNSILGEYWAGNAPLFTHPAPEPVSAPVKWEDRTNSAYHMGTVPHLNAVYGELTEWRALAAKRGWVK